MTDISAFSACVASSRLYCTMTGISLLHLDRVGNAHRNRRPVLASELVRICFVLLPGTTTQNVFDRIAILEENRERAAAPPPTSSSARRWIRGSSSAAASSSPECSRPE